MKELRTKVEDVSQRNVRYRLIRGPDTKSAASIGQSSMTGETMSGIEEARRQRDKEKVEIIRLINSKDENLRVIAVWGSSGVMEKSIIK
nr:unnamed protein product [Digitaria exilis]CAB3483672.1 unnamed protein product [Digitaria exilis]